MYAAAPGTEAPLPGGEAAQFWWIALLMFLISGIMLWFFRKKGWI